MARTTWVGASLAAGLHRLDLAATAVEVADDVAHELASGIVTSTFMTGSRMTGSAFGNASLTAIEPAILNAISDESTSWYDPSKSVTLTSTTG